MKRNGRSLHRFSHIELGNWRNFQRVDVDLQRRVFLVGPNASGKSNLLDVFKFLRDIVAVGGGFQDAVARRGNVSKLRCLAARRYPEIVIQVRVSDTENSAWSYRLGFTQDNRRRPLIRSETVTRIEGSQQTVILKRPLDEDKRDPERLRQTHLEQVMVNEHFRELANFFRSVDYLNIIPQLVRDPDRYRGQPRDPFGWDFIQKIADTSDRIRMARLGRIRNALRVAVPQLQDFELYRDRRGVPHLRGRYEHWRPKGAWQQETEFSDGTLRLMGLLWAILDGQGPLLLEEPEMSLHSDIVRYIPQMIHQMQRRTSRQVIVSSHSADILRDEGVGLDEVILLQPSSEGTTVHLANSLTEIRKLLEGGGNLSDAIIAHTRPKHVETLSLFGD